MLLPDEVHPYLSVYYNGALVLQALQNRQNISLLDLYADVRCQHEMSLSVYLLCLDWLYLIGTADVNSQGEVVLCS